jgi:hypothetical protein
LSEKIDDRHVLSASSAFAGRLTGKTGFRIADRTMQLVDRHEPPGLDHIIMVT